MIIYATVTFGHSLSANQTFASFLVQYSHTHQMDDKSWNRTDTLLFFHANMPPNLSLWKFLSKLQCVLFVLKGSAGIGGGCTGKVLYGWGGRARLLLGGGISAILLVLGMLTSFRLVRLCQIVRQLVVAEQHFFFPPCPNRLFNGDYQVCSTLFILAL